MLEEGRRLGITEEELLSDYPGLTRADLASAWEYAKQNPAEVDRAIKENKKG